MREWAELNDLNGVSPGGAVIVLTFVFEEQDGTWIGRCAELGTATYGKAREEVRAKLTSLVRLYLNVLENTHKRERVFLQHGVIVHREPLSDLAARLQTVDSREYLQPFHAELQAA